MKTPRPKLVVGVAVVISLFILIGLVQETNRRWQVQREVQRLEQETRSMQKKVIELQNLNQYFRSDAYQERLAREKLNYQAEGEKVVLIPEEPPAVAVQSNELANETVPASIPMRWWNVFFVDERPFESMRAVRETS